MVEPLRSVLAENPLVEIGGGTSAAAHSKFFTSTLKVSDYRSVDSNTPQSSVSTQEDVLPYLAKMRAGTNIVAFGFFNEPFSPGLAGMLHSGAQRIRPSAADPTALLHARTIEWEYTARVLDEVARIVPKGGLLFGDGLHPLFYMNLTEELLMARGFAKVEPLYKLARARVLLSGSKIYDPFFLVRT